MIVNTNDMETGSVMLHLNLGRPNQPSFVLVIRNDHCYRLDVNQPHREFPGTHIQWQGDSMDDERTRDARQEFPPIPKDGVVHGEEYAATFRAFAKYLNIDTSAMQWVDPPERSAL
ncbi:hypothetical protein NOCA2210004 [metagenome]|uniref:Uncharacterized protein n=1 Tax=metagenome TaxID=256318 RepID=A0A2P2BY31_9ZZZZ